jgi:hypothetical protein
MPAYLFRSLAIRSGLPGSRFTSKKRGTLETAEKSAAYESLRMTKLYDRTDEQLRLDELEKISV